MDRPQKELWIQLLQSTDIFSVLNSKTCEDLLPALKEINLSPGDILFQQHAKAESFYIVIDGILSASLTLPNGEQKIIGLIHKGETVGELGALSKEPRTLTVRATLHSRLFELSVEHFEEFCATHPTIVFPLLRLIISRSRKTLQLLSDDKKIKRIALICGDNDTVFFNNFIQSFTPYLTQRPKIHWIKEFSDEHSLINHLENTGDDYHILIFVATEQNLKFLANHSIVLDSLYLIIKAKPEFKPTRLPESILEFPRAISLVLVHDTQATTLKGIQHILPHFSKIKRYHHCRFNHTEDYLRLRRYIEGRAVGLVLGGGGAKGWASLGVIKALHEKKIPIDAIGGTSVGAMLAGFYAQSLDYEITKEKFQNVAHSIGESPFAWGHLTWPIISFLSGKKPTTALQKECGEEYIENLWIPFFATSCNLSTYQEVTHQTGLLWQVLRASAAIPGLVPPMVIDGHLHVDGGVSNNLPTDIMREWLGDSGFIIAVNLTKLGKRIRTYNFPPSLPFRIGFLRKLHLAYLNYRFPPFMDTFLQALLIGSSAREDANKLIANILISPDLKGFHTLRNKTDNIEKMIQLGYDQIAENFNSLKGLYEKMD